MSHLVNHYDAKSQLSRLIDRAAAGENMAIARAGKPIVHRGPVASAQPGLLKGLALPDAVFAACGATVIRDGATATR